MLQHLVYIVFWELQSRLHYYDLSINVSFNPTRSIIADVTPEGKERTRGYTWMQTISGFFGLVHM